METRSINKITSDAIYIAKGFAILFVVCAHCNQVNKDTNNLNRITSLILNNIGTFGVGIFLFVSGYLMAHSKKNTYEYFNSKIKNLLIPWLCCGTLVYFYVKIRKGGISIISLCEWLIGYKTYLYFMTILVFCIIVVWNLRKNKKVLLILTIVEIITFIIYNLKYEINSFSYLNPINFMMYFSAGAFFEIVNDKIMKKGFLFCFMILLSLIIILDFLEIKINYFKWHFFIIEFLVIFLVLKLSYIILNFSIISKCFTKIGKISFSIYLLHMPMAGMIARIFNHSEFFIITLIRPIVVIAMTMIAIIILKILMNKMPNRISNVIGIAVGMR